MIVGKYGIWGSDLSFDPVKLDATMSQAYMSSARAWSVVPSRRCFLEFVYLFKPFVVFEMFVLLLEIGSNLVRSLCGQVVDCPWLQGGDTGAKALGRCQIHEYSPVVAQDVEVEWFISDCLDASRNIGIYQYVVND